MNLVKRIINLGTGRQTDPIYNKYIRFINSVSLIVCSFTIQNALLAVYYNELLIASIFITHCALLALMPVFTHRGKRVLAGAWFSGVAIVLSPFTLSPSPYTV